MSGDAGDIFDEMWSTGAWLGESRSDAEWKADVTQRKNGFLLEMLSDRRYERALEIGCGVGAFTRELSRLVGGGVALDVSEQAVAEAVREGGTPLQFRVADVMKFPMREEGPWDLIVVSDTMPYVGWRYTFFETSWLARELYESTRPRGRVLVTNLRSGVEDWLYRPWLIDTYRDLFANVGYEMERERSLKMHEDELPMEFLASLFVRAA